MESKNTRKRLSELQGLPLRHKLMITQKRIEEWVDEYGEDGVYVSFSGGKDSTVLFDIIRKMGYMNIPALFVDTGLEYPRVLKVLKNRLTGRNDFDGIPLMYDERSKRIYGDKDDVNYKFGCFRGGDGFTYDTDSPFM